MMCKHYRVHEYHDSRLQDDILSGGVSRQPEMTLNELDDTGHHSTWKMRMMDIRVGPSTRDKVSIVVKAVVLKGKNLWFSNLFGYFKSGVIVFPLL